MLCAKLLQSCPAICDPINHSPPGSSVHGILQARILEWVASAFLQGIFPTQGSNTCLFMSSALAGQFTVHKMNPIDIDPHKQVFLSGCVCVCVCVCCGAQSYLALCNPMDCGLPDSSVPGFFLGKNAGWVAISYSRGCSQPGDQIHISCFSCIGR